VLAMEKLVQRYGGIFHKEPKRAWIMVRAIFSGLISPWEIPRLIHANNVSLEAMNEELLCLDLSRSVPSVDVPVLFFSADTIATRMQNWQPIISKPYTRRSSGWCGSRNPRTTFLSRNQGYSMPQFHASCSR
jgi:hypothetical protein